MVRSVLFLWFLTGAVSWGASGPLTFGDCIALLSSQNPEFLSSLESYQSQEALTQGSFSAFTPSINATFGYLKTHPASGFDPRFTSGLNVSYSLFTGLRDVSRLSAARASLELALANLDSVRARVSSQLRQSFAQYLYAQENVRLTSMIRERRSQNERLVRAQYETGRENEGSYLFSKGLLEQSEFDERVARDSLVLATQSLSFVLGDSSGTLQITGPMPEESPPESVTLDTLLSLTPAHRIQKARVAISEANYGVARSGFLPSLDLGGSLSFSDREATFNKNQQTSFSANLTLPLFSGLSTLREVQSTLALERSARALQKSTEFEILNALRQTLFVYQQSIQKLRVDLSIQRAATIRATIARKRYHSGLLAFEQWDIIETDLINRQKAALASLRDRRIAEANYRQTQGLGDFQ